MFQIKIILCTMVLFFSDFAKSDKSSPSLSPEPSLSQTPSLDLCLNDNDPSCGEDSSSSVPSNLKWIVVACIGSAVVVTVIGMSVLGTYCYIIKKKKSRILSQENSFERRSSSLPVPLDPPSPHVVQRPDGQRLAKLPSCSTLTSTGSIAITMPLMGGSTSSLTSLDTPSHPSSFLMYQALIAAHLHDLGNCLQAINLMSIFEGGSSSSEFIETFQAEFSHMIGMHHELMSFVSAGSVSLDEAHLKDLIHKIRILLAKFFERLKLLKLCQSQQDTELIALLEAAFLEAEEILGELDQINISSAKLHLVRRTINISELLRSVIAAFQAKMRERNLIFEFPETIEGLVHCDVVLVRRVLRNLLSNALKFTPSGGIIRLVVSVNAGLLTIRVINSGPVLSPEEQRQLFGFRSQIRPTEMQAGGGHGIGLWISKEIIEEHGGIISYEASSAGSIFSFSIPLNEGMGMGAGAASAPARASCL